MAIRLYDEFTLHWGPTNSESVCIMLQSIQLITKA